MRRSLRPTSVITILSLCTSYLPSIVAGTLTASDGSVRSGSNSTPVYSSTTGLAPTSTSRPSTDLNTNANLDFSTNANLNANSTSTTGNDTTRLVKLQLKSNTSRCLSAIIDDDGYAQPELTLITNCTLGTTWNVSSDFAVAADDQDGDTRTSSPSRIRCQACRDDVVIDGGRLGNANGTGAALLAVEDEQSLGQLISISPPPQAEATSKPSDNQTQADLCLSETKDQDGYPFVRSEWCGTGNDTEGSYINQIWNLIEAS